MEMTQLVCPLCGRFVSIEHFNPNRGLDIVAVEVKGLGRGKGVTVTDRYSILAPGDSTVERIKGRILELAGVLMDTGCLDVDEVVCTLDIETADPDEVDALRSEAENLEASHEALTEGLAGVIKDVEDALSEEYDWDFDADEDPLQALGERVTELIMEYESLEAGGEDADE